jgi:hypothetical protein
MKKRNRQLLCGWAVCALLMATTASAKAPVQRPWKAHGITTLVLDLTKYMETGDPVCDFWADGAGEATHVGRFTSGGVHTFNLDTGEITGECWLKSATPVLANQEQLFFRPNPISADAFFYEISRGTGRFQNAAGSFIETTLTLSEEVVVVEDDSGQYHTYLVTTTSYTDIGTITY